MRAWNVVGMVALVIVAVAVTGCAKAELSRWQTPPTVTVEGNASDAEWMDVYEVVREINAALPAGFQVHLSEEEESERLGGHISLPGVGEVRVYFLDDYAWGEIDWREISKVPGKGHCGKKYAGCSLVVTDRAGKIDRAFVLIERTERLGWRRWLVAHEMLHAMGLMHSSAPPSRTVMGSNFNSRAQPPGFMVGADDAKVLKALYPQ